MARKYIHADSDSGRGRLDPPPSYLLGRARRYILLNNLDGGVLLEHQGQAIRQAPKSLPAVARSPALPSAPAPLMVALSPHKILLPSTRLGHREGKGGC